MTPQEAFKIISNRYRWIVKDRNGHIKAFVNKPNIEEYKTYPCFWVAQGESGLPLDFQDHIQFSKIYWEHCIEEREPDYRDWIGKICYFWDIEESSKTIHQLYDITYESAGGIFKTTTGNCYRHCLPVKKEDLEVMIYENSK